MDYLCALALDNSPSYNNFNNNLTSMVTVYR